jgi:hypothetical protein
MTIWSLLRSHVSDPGIIPLGLSHPIGFPDPLVCDICRSWKPPRAHHSRLLNRCVFRMDHVCRWIGNVVGYSNQKFFILLLCYSCAGCITNIALSLTVLLLYEISTLILISLVLHVGLLLLLRGFLGDQLDFLESNVTLIETFRNCETKRDIDVFRQIFGANCIVWIFPVYSSSCPDYTEETYPGCPLREGDAADLDISLTQSALNYSSYKKVS